jgi:hypothetical protein
MRHPLVKLLLLTGQRLNEVGVIITGDPAACQQVADDRGGFSVLGLVLRHFSLPKKEARRSFTMIVVAA